MNIEGVLVEVREATAKLPHNTRNETLICYHAYRKILQDKGTPAFVALILVFCEVCENEEYEPFLNPKSDKENSP